MPALLQPKAAFAADAIVVGDPGRALLLAQDLLEQPKMCNHARGLWGYRGETANGSELTIQSTGVGAPSAAAVLADLAELGVRRAVRIGTCRGLGGAARIGELLIVEEAVAAEGSATALGVPVGELVEPDPALRAGLTMALGETARAARIVSLDAMPVGPFAGPAGTTAADMQTLAVLARGGALGLEAAALLVVVEDEAGGEMNADELEVASKRAGEAAACVLSG